MERVRIKLVEANLGDRIVRLADDDPHMSMELRAAFWAIGEGVRKIEHSHRECIDAGATLYSAIKIARWVIPIQFLIIVALLSLRVFGV